MKKILLCLMILVASISSFCQQIDSSQVHDRKYYLEKSRSQKIGGFILLGSGITIITIISNGKTSFDELGFLAVIGTFSTLGSIPVFIASGRNKRIALNATAYLQMEKIPILQQSVLNFQSFPAISVRINF